MRIWLPAAIQFGLTVGLAVWRHFGEGRSFGDALPAPTQFVEDGWPLLLVAALAILAFHTARRGFHNRRVVTSALFGVGLATNAFSAWSLTQPFTSLLHALHR